MYNQDIILDKSSAEGRLVDREDNLEGHFSESGKEEDRAIDLFARLQVAQDEIEELKARNHDLEARIKALEAAETRREGCLEEGIARVMRHIAHDRRRITQLEDGPEATEMVRGRAEKIARYLQERADHRADFVQLRGLLGVDRVRLHEAIRYLLAENQGRYGVTHQPKDKRKKLLVMLPRLG